MPLAKESPLRLIDFIKDFIIENAGREWSKEKLASLQQLNFIPWEQLHALNRRGAETQRNKKTYAFLGASAPLRFNLKDTSQTPNKKASRFLAGRKVILTHFHRNEVIVF